MIEDLIENPVRFIPPDGTTAEWPELELWTDREWSHWLAEHNKYPFLRQWSSRDIAQYLDHDRWNYGLHFRRPGDPNPWWFYVPTPIAVPFHACKVPNILFGGAAGGSKSYSARFDAYRHCFGIPEFRAIIMRRTFTELERNHLDKAKMECTRVNNYFGRELMRFTTDPPSITFLNHGDDKVSKITFGHCQNPGDEEKYLGDEYHAFYPDEMATFLKKQITGVQGRLRAVNRRVKPRLGGTSNPGGGQTLWLKDYYIDKRADIIRQENPRYKPENYHFLGAMLYDNPYYMDADGTYTTYEDRLFEYDAERRKQMLLGDWSALEGQFFPEFSKLRHVDNFPIPEGSRFERWIDWGYSPHYGICQWVAILPSGRIYLFMEWKFNGAGCRKLMVASEVAQQIRRYTDEQWREIVGRKARMSKTVADPSMWGTSGHTGESYAETFQRNGVGMVKGDNDRVLGWGRMRHWLRNAPDGRPWFMVHPDCVVTIRCLESVVRDKNDPDDVDTTSEDHPADALRYGFMARPMPKGEAYRSRIVIPDTASALLASVVNVNTRSLGGLVS